jgi:hypothetical protein
MLRNAIILRPLESPCHDGSNGGLIVYLSTCMILLLSPHQGGPNGGLIIKILFLSILIGLIV